MNIIQAGSNPYDDPNNFVMAPEGMSCVNAFHALYTYPFQRVTELSGAHREIKFDVALNLGMTIDLYCRRIDLSTATDISEIFLRCTDFNYLSFHCNGDFTEYPKINVKEYNNRFSQIIEGGEIAENAALTALQNYQKLSWGEKIDPFDLFDFNKLTQAKQNFKAIVDGDDKFKPLNLKVNETLGKMMPHLPGNIYVRDLSQGDLNSIQSKLASLRELGLKPYDLDFDPGLLKEIPDLMEETSLPVEDPVTIQSRNDNNVATEDASTKENDAVEQICEAGVEPEPVHGSEVKKQELADVDQETHPKKQETNTANEVQTTGEDVFSSFQKSRASKVTRTKKRQRNK